MVPTVKTVHKYKQITPPRSAQRMYRRFPLPEIHANRPRRKSVRAFRGPADGRLHLADVLKVLGTPCLLMAPNENKRHGKEQRARAEIHKPAMLQGVCLAKCR